MNDSRLFRNVNRQLPGISTAVDKFLGALLNIYFVHAMTYYGGGGRGMPFSFLVCAHVYTTSDGTFIEVKSASLLSK